MVSHGITIITCRQSVWNYFASKLLISRTAHTSSPTQTQPSPYAECWPLPFEYIRLHFSSLSVCLHLVVLSIHCCITSPLIACYVMLCVCAHDCMNVNYAVLVCLPKDGGLTCGSLSSSAASVVSGSKT